MSYPVSQICFKRVGDGPPAFMVHGNPATHTLWRPIVQRVMNERTVYTMDLPGFGGSPLPAHRTDLSLPHLAEALLGFADLQGIEQFDLIGHSFGGAVAITMTTMAPERIRSLVAITPMTDYRPPLAHLLGLPLMEDVAGLLWRMAPSDFRRWFARTWTHISYGGGYSRTRAEEVAGEADRPDIVPSLCGVMKAADYAAYARSIQQLESLRKLPLLLVGAGSDRVIPYTQFQHLCQNLPRATCHIFPASGHVPMWQYPDELADVVKRFWVEASAQR